MSWNHTTEASFGFGEKYKEKIFPKEVAFKMKIKRQVGQMKSDRVFQAKVILCTNAPSKGETCHIRGNKARVSWE